MVAKAESRTVYCAYMCRSNPPLLAINLKGIWPVNLPPAWSIALKRALPVLIVLSLYAQLAEQSSE